jgi:hypothetical protein
MKSAESYHRQSHSSSTREPLPFGFTDSVTTFTQKKKKGEKEVIDVQYFFPRKIFLLVH